MKEDLRNFALLLKTFLFLSIFFSLSQHFVLATCTGTNKQFLANPSGFNQSSTWVASFTLSEDASTYSIGYELSKGKMISGTTTVSFSGDVPCCYEKTIQTTPGIDGGIISLDFNQGPKLLLAGNVITLTIAGITNPSAEPLGIDNIFLYSSAPNEPVAASCNVGSIYLSQSTPTATPTSEPSPTPLPTSTPVPPQPTTTPIPPTQTPTEQNPTSIPQPTITAKKSPPPATSKIQNSPTPKPTPTISSQGITPINTPINKEADLPSTDNQGQEKEFSPEKMALALIFGESTTLLLFGLFLIFINMIKNQ